MQRHAAQVLVLTLIYEPTTDGTTVIYNIYDATWSEIRKKNKKNDDELTNSLLCMESGIDLNKYIQVKQKKRASLSCFHYISLIGN